MTLPTPSSNIHLSLPPCQFVAGPMITDLRLFVGRKRELQTITTNMVGVQPVSINVVGERRIGKSSLLYHFFQTWEQRVQDPSRFVVIYLSLQNANSKKKSDFYQAIARELLSHPLVYRKKHLTSCLEKDSFDDSIFANALKHWKQNNVLPVLCLDEFEAWLKYQDEFNDGFYDHLRSLMNENALMLVVASHKELDLYRQQNLLTSTFFNLGHVLPLRELAEEEAMDLVRLPASNVPDTQPDLTAEEQRLAREWGGKHPYLLQLASSFLCQARHQGQSTNWALRKFKDEQNRLPKPISKIGYLWRPLLWVVRDLPVRLGYLSKKIGKSREDAKAWLFGMVILIVSLVLVVLIILHVITLNQFIETIKGLIKTLGG